MESLDHTCILQSTNSWSAARAALPSTREADNMHASSCAGQLECGFSVQLPSEAWLQSVSPGILTVRRVLLQVAANLMTDEMLMRSAQLTPEYRPLVDFHVQYSTVQSQKGWRYGYTDASRPMERNTTFHEMVWHPHKNGHLADGRWQATEVGL